MALKLVASAFHRSSSAVSACADMALVASCDASTSYACAAGIAGARASTAPAPIAALNVGSSLQPLGVEDDLACLCREDDACECRRAWEHGDREMMVAEPDAEAIGVTVELHPRHADAGGAVARRGLAGKRCPAFPFDEEGMRRFGRRPLDAGQSPAQELTASSRP